MAKKLSPLIAAASAILAFAAPSIANATDATCPAGTTCPVGTKITKTAKNVTLDTELVGQLSCRSLNLNGEITKNSNNEVAGKGPDELNPAQTECYDVEPSRKITVTTVELSLAAKDTTGPTGATRKGTVSFVTKIDLPSGALCTFTGTNIPGTFVSGQSPAVLTMTDPAKDVTSTGGCGKAKLIAECTLEKTGTTTPVVLD